MKSQYLAALICAAGFAQQTAELTRQMERTVLYRDIAISADGTKVAWAQTTADNADSVVYRASLNARASKPELVRTGRESGRRDTNPTWSPDGKSLAFLSNSEGGDQMQVWISTSAGNASARSKLVGYVDRLRWSPDGKHLAFLYIEGAGGGGPLMAAPVQLGVIESEIHNQRIAVLDLASGDVRSVSPDNLHVYDFDWSPDSARFVATAAPGPGDNNWWIARIHVIDGATGVAKEIYRPKLQVAIPRWSPDGRQIAFIEGLMSDEGFHGGDLFTISAEGGAAVNRTPGRTSSPSSVQWLTSLSVLFTEWVGGGSSVSRLDLSSGKTEVLLHGNSGLHSDGILPNFAASRDGRIFAFVDESFTRPPEVRAGPAGSYRQLTRENADQTAQWGDAANLEWTSDGRTVQGWLLPPKSVVPGRRYPMVVLVHGGPSNSTTQSWMADFTLPVALASQGYYVLFPNPRGSYGQGEDFTRANVRDFGGGDLRDILAGVDAALARYPLDPERVGITGWSYGGYMSMWSVTQTTRFRAAVAGAGIANWQSYYGENLIDQWMIPFFGASVYDDPAVYAKSSPITFIKNVKTPTLILVGERDAECPAPQSFEFWHALKTLGVPTQLVVFGGEGHWFAKREHRIEVQDRAVAWFNQYLAGK